MKIAAAAYRPEWHGSFDTLGAKLDRWVSDATTHGCDLLVFPEYAGIEAALLTAGGPCATPQAWRDRMATVAKGWDHLHVDLARHYGVTILAGSLSAAHRGKWTNRAALVTPDGKIGHQHKLIPTPYEREQMGLTGSDTLNLFDTALGKIGVLICYDSEFPLFARYLVEAGADMILVPSCTDLPAGQTRVRQSARARAIEGQCLVVQAPLVGTVPGCDVADVSTGRAGFFAPPDHGLPSDGILAQGETDQPGWTYLEVDAAAIAAPRASGQVGNAAHWPEQDRISQVQVTPL